MTFANSLDPDQAQQNVGSGSNLFDTQKEFSKKLILKKSADEKEHEKYPTHSFSLSIGKLINKVTKCHPDSLGININGGDLYIT